jgi:hypothetical protein
MRLMKWLRSMWHRDEVLPEPVQRCVVGHSPRRLIKNTNRDIL